MVSDVTQLGDIQSTIDRLTALRENMFPDASKNIDSAQKKAERAVQAAQGFRARHTYQEGRYGSAFKHA